MNWFKKCDAYTCACSIAQSRLTLCDPMDCSPPGSSVHGISQARILEWVAIFYSRGSSRPRDRTHVSCLLHWQANSLPLCHLGSPPAVYSNPWSLSIAWLYFIILKNDLYLLGFTPLSVLKDLLFAQNLYFICGPKNETRRKIFSQ